MKKQGLVIQTTSNLFDSVTRCKINNFIFGPTCGWFLSCKFQIPVQTRTGQKMERNWKSIGIPIGIPQNGRFRSEFIRFYFSESFSEFGVSVKSCKIFKKYLYFWNFTILFFWKLFIFYRIRSEISIVIQ